MQFLLLSEKQRFLRFRLKTQRESRRFNVRFAREAPPPESIGRCVPARIAWLRVAARGGRLAVSFTVLRRFRRRGRRAYGTGVLKAIVHFLQLALRLAGDGSGLFRPCKPRSL
jgi:hypothetical protein